jgi:hypothetical protein
MPVESGLFVKTSVAALVFAFVWGAWMAFMEARLRRSLLANRLPLPLQA